MKTPGTSSLSRELSTLKFNNAGKAWCESGAESPGDRRKGQAPNQRLESDLEMAIRLSVVETSMNHANVPDATGSADRSNAGDAESNQDCSTPAKTPKKAQVDGSNNSEVVVAADAQARTDSALKSSNPKSSSNITATPIPRTLQFSLMSARDLSIINTPPPNRQPVHTEVMAFDEYAIRDAIYYETERGGQVYFVHNRVQSLPEIGNILRNLCPDLSIGVAHGQMEGHKLEEALLNFIERRYDVLCCTNIIESGVDISNANTIIINNAHQFGLSDLHQLRGRVGRSNKKAFCYLVAPPLSTLPDDSRKRLQTLEQFNELGSGFQIAMRDLDIRGAGNLLGGEQSGFIAEIGFEMYQKILNEAMRELKTTDFKEVFSAELERKKDFVDDCTIDTDLEILIPDTYVENITERLSLYTQMDNIENEEEMQLFATELQDRFGPIPPQVNDLFTTLHCRHIACQLGFEKLILKNEQMRLYFLSNPESPYFESDTFNHILKHIQTRTNNAHLKQVGKNFLLVVNKMRGMNDVQKFLERMVKKEEVKA